MLKYPLVAGMYMEKTVVVAATSAVKTAVTLTLNALSVAGPEVAILGQSGISSGIYRSSPSRATAP